MTAARRPPSVAAMVDRSGEVTVLRHGRGEQLLVANANGVMHLEI